MTNRLHAFSTRLVEMVRARTEDDAERLAAECLAMFDGMDAEEQAIARGQIETIGWVTD